MKHRKIQPTKVDENTYTIMCFLGNIHVRRERKDWIVHCHSKNKHTLFLTKRLESDGTFKQVRYKSIEQVTQAIEKVSNDFFREEIKFWFEE